jgi:hypothetical protein
VSVSVFALANTGQWSIDEREDEEIKRMRRRKK